MPKLSKDQAIAQLYELGELSWILKGVQKDIHDYLINNNSDVSCVLCSRRLGKTFTLAVLADETCRKNPNSIVKFAMPQQRQVKTVLKPIMRIILEKCPKELKPQWYEQDKVYRYPNGSEIQIAGCDNGNAENLRGGASLLCIIDEAGFIDDLDYVVNSILLPTTDTTGGKLVMASTPNYKDPNHEFHESFVFPMEASGNIAKFTIYDSPMLTSEQIERIKSRYVGGDKNPKFRCEYLVEIPRTSELTVIPEFNEDTKNEIVTENFEVPPFYDPYVSMDVGFKDLTVALFAYYDFREAKLVILDELVMNGPEMTTDRLADEIRHREKLRFYDETLNEEKEVYLRIMDNDLKLINDLSRLHNIQFIPTKKDNKEAAINNLRMWINEKRIVIHPRCVHLIYHLQNAQWDKNRKKFKHLKDSPNGNIRGGHADACFTPDMLVTTKHGVKSIKDIKIGDLVLTHKNRFKKVTNVMSRNYKGDILEVNPFGTESIYCTPEHKFWSTSLEKSRKNTLTGQLIDVNSSWKEAKKLNTSTALNFSYNKEIKNINKSKVECFIYGYYLAEGNVSGNQVNLEFAGNKNSNGQKILYPDKSMNKELRACGKGINKRFPDWVYDLDQEQTVYFIAGYLFGDGHFGKTGISYNSISPSIAYGIASLLNKININPSIRLKRRAKEIEICGKSCKQKDIYECKIKNFDSVCLLEAFMCREDLRYVFSSKEIKTVIKNCQKNHFKHSLKRIKSIKTKPYNGLVYTLEVEDDHSYNVNGISVKNCDAFIYLVRNIMESKNPYPDNFGRLQGSGVVDTNYGRRNTNKSVTEFMKKMLNIKPKN